MKTPAVVTIEFFADYKKWNDFAFAAKKIRMKIQNTKLENQSRFNTEILWP